MHGYNSDAIARMISITYVDENHVQLDNIALGIDK